VEAAILHANKNKKKTLTQIEIEEYRRIEEVLPIQALIIYRQQAIQAFVVEEVDRLYKSHALGKKSS
jgi:hypothetical protein